MTITTSAEGVNISGVHFDVDNVGEIDFDDPGVQAALAQAGVKVIAVPDEVVIDEDHELIGSTLEVVYDPAIEAVLSFSIRDLRPTNGCLTVHFADGLIDPALLDSDHMVTPQTRVLDFQAFEPLLESLRDIAK